MSHFGVRLRGRFVGLLCVLSLVLPAGVVLAQKDLHGDWKPTSEFAAKFDWVQMTSGEWVKGEIIAMYDENLEFDSDEFDDLSLGWDDIAQIHSSEVMNVGFNDGSSAIGLLALESGKITITASDGTTQEFNKNDVLTITAGPPKEINFWSMKIFIGVIVRSGNSDVFETNAQANFKRRTIHNRLTFDFVANQNRTEGVDVADNARFNVGWDRFINKRFFVKPVIAEFFRDPFQNIGRRATLSVGVGYQLIDSKKVDWEINGAPGYQETRFDSVSKGTPEKESTPAFTIGTTTDWDITKWLEFNAQYRIQFVNEESGTYNHHMLISFETDITKLIDFDISWIWDRIEDPTPDAEGNTPEQDDFRTTVGLTFDF